jgi:signal transduction histidine kinase
MLFRALRELLINVARHARSGKAQVRIARDGAVAEIAVEDEGVGFDPAEIQGFGLRNLHDRLEHLGGEVAVDSAPGRGTRVRVRAPIHGNEPSAPQAPEREVDHDDPRASGR